MDFSKLNTHTLKLLEAVQTMINEAAHVESLSKKLIKGSAFGGADSFMVALTIFVLACIVGFFIIWRVTPALHSPLMAITNAISSIIIIGAIMLMGDKANTPTLIFGFLAILLSTINIVGGFTITHRMLHLFASSTVKKH